MKNEDKIYRELAPCGVYCGACPSFDKSCFGCASINKYQKRKSKWACRIRRCCYAKMAYEYCIQCEKYPCEIYRKKLLSSHKEDPRYSYRYEITALFPHIRILGIERYIQFQKKRWTCELCGGQIRFYDYQCDKCGAYTMVHT